MLNRLPITCTCNALSGLIQATGGPQNLLHQCFHALLILGAGKVTLCIERIACMAHCMAARGNPAFQIQ